MGFIFTNFRALTLVLAASIYPVFLLYSLNLREVSFIQIIPSIIFLLFVGIIIYFILQPIFKNQIKQGIVAFPLILFLWNFERIYGLLSGKGIRYVYVLLAFILIMILIVVIVGKVKSVKTLNNIYLLLISPIFVLICFNILGILSSKTYLEEEQNKFTKQKNLMLNEMEPSGVSFDEEKYPDIYLIVLDEFANYQTIKESFGYLEFDSTYFRDQGFYNASQSEVRYADTGWSLPTLLNLNYPTEYVTKETYWNYIHQPNIALDQVEIDKFKGVNTKKLFDLWDNNYLMKFLKESGYQINVIEGVSKFFPIQFSLADNHKSPRYIGSKDISNLNDIIGFDIFNPFTIEVVKNSLFNLPFSYYNDAFITKYIFEYLNSEFNESKQPQFILAHIVCPHAPFVFNEDGEVKPMLYSIKNKKEAYLEQYIYILNETQNLVKNIKEKTNNNAIIIIQSDHGPRPHMTDIKDYKESFKIFNMIYFPDQKYSELYKTIGQPNTLRVLLNKYFNAQLELIEDR